MTATASGTIGTEGAAGGTRGGPRLLTPELRFNGVENGRSRVQAVEVESMQDQPVDLEVTGPPLAPFSVTARPGRPRRAWSPTGDDAAVRHRGGDEIWVRYDATSPMATDAGRLTIRDRCSGRSWTVQLRGTGALARRTAQP